MAAFTKSAIRRLFGTSSEHVPGVYYPYDY
jgi:hypothetical protein